MSRVALIIAGLSLALSGCAHRSGYSVAASPGYSVTYPEISWDFPQPRAFVRYKSHEDCVASAKAQAAERHREQVAPSPAGGRLVILVYLQEVRHYEHLEAIALRGGKVVGRERFPFRDVSLNREGSGFTAATVLDLAQPPTASDPVTLEVVGIGLNGAPYRFTVAPAL